MFLQIKEIMIAPYKTVVNYVYLAQIYYELKQTIYTYRLYKYDIRYILYIINSRNIHNTIDL